MAPKVCEMSLGVGLKAKIQVKPENTLRPKPHVSVGSYGVKLMEASHVHVFQLRCWLLVSGGCDMACLRVA